MTEEREDDIEIKIKKLRSRIKNTSSVRFAASKRIKFNYSIANLTVIVLSLWAIFISYILTSDLVTQWNVNVDAWEAAGIVLPVFIVVFSLIEGGETFLRAHLLELNARLLRELGDELFGEAARIDGDPAQRAELFKKYSRKYNDILERSPINHDDVDHWSRHYSRCRHDSKEFSVRWFYFTAIIAFVWMRRQGQRALYFSLWVLPIALFFARAA